MSDALNAALQENIALRCLLGGGCDANNDGLHMIMGKGRDEFCINCGEMTRNGKSKPWLDEDRLERTIARLSPSPVWFAGCAVSDFDATPGISDAVLLERAVRSARARRGRGAQPRWVGVMDSFALGSTYSRGLCRRFGLDPDEQVKR